MSTLYIHVYTVCNSALSIHTCLLLKYMYVNHIKTKFEYMICVWMSLCGDSVCVYLCVSTYMYVHLYTRMCLCLSSDSYIHVDFQQPHMCK